MSRPIERNPQTVIRLSIELQNLGYEAGQIAKKLQFPTVSAWRRYVNRNGLTLREPKAAAN